MHRIVRKWAAVPPAVPRMHQVLIDPKALAILKLLERYVAFQEMVREPPRSAVLARAPPIAAVVRRCRRRCLRRGSLHICNQSQEMYACL